MDTVAFFKKRPYIFAFSDTFYNCTGGYFICLKNEGKGCCGKLQIQQKRRCRI